MTKATLTDTIRTKTKSVLQLLLVIFARTILYGITPGYYIFWTAYVLPDIATFYKLGTINMTILFMIPSFFFVNAMGNMLLVLYTDSKVVKSDIPKPGDIFCDLCKAYHPTNSWCCAICNACILEREQHCWIFESCIGLRNRRYYVLYLTYVSFICTFCGFCSLIYLLDLFGPLDLVWEIAKVVAQTSPLLPKRLKRKFNQNTAFFFFSFTVAELIGPLAYYHMNNVMAGLTLRERKAGKQGSDDWRGNMAKVFGTDWRSAVVWPFTESHLPPLPQY